MFLTHVAFAQARAASGMRARSSAAHFDSAAPPPPPLARSLEPVEARAPRPEAAEAPRPARAERRLSPPVPAARRPNVLIFYTDDVGCDWISAYRREPGCAGGGPETPHVDAIAAHADGFRFRAFWSEPMCTPSRVQLLTGQHPWRTGWVMHHDVPRWGGTGLELGRSNATSLAREFRDAGYRTALAGKWQLHHLGRRPSALEEFGFEEHCVWPGNEIGYPSLTDQSKYWSPVLQENGVRARHERWAPRRGRNATAGGATADAAEQKGYGPRIINEFVNGFVARDDARGRPFFVLYAMLLCHKPLAMPPGASGAGVMEAMVKYGKRRSRERRLPFRHKTPRLPPPLSLGRRYMDALVGETMRALAATGALDSTVVIFSSDHGSSERAPPVSAAGVSKPAARSRQSRKANKGQLIDAGVRVPFLLRVPRALLLAQGGGLFAPSGRDGGVVVSEPADSADVLPTLRALASLPALSAEVRARVARHGRARSRRSEAGPSQRPPNPQVRVDGRSLLPLLAPGGASAAHAVAFSQFAWRHPEQPAPDGSVALRRARMVRDARWLLKAPALRPGELLLFDLERDPHMKDAIDESTREPEAVSARARLRDALERRPPDAPAPFEGYLRVETSLKRND